MLCSYYGDGSDVDIDQSVPRVAMSCTCNMHEVIFVCLPSCFMLGLKAILVTVSLCPLKCRSSVGSSWGGERR